MPILRFHLLLGLLLLALALLNLAIGSVPLDLSEVWAALTGNASVPETTRLIVVHYRLPQMLVALTAVGRQERFSRIMRRAWDTVSPWVNLLVTWLLALAALLMALDSGAYLLAGHFLVR